jgi:hypothetical protein
MNTVDIYRVEDESGEGIFNSDAADFHPWFGLYMSDLYPSARRDKKIGRTQRSTEYCGVTSKEALAYWFPLDVMEMLKTAGAVVRHVVVTSDHVVDGEKQVLFHMQHAKTVEIYPVGRLLQEVDCYPTFETIVRTAIDNGPGITYAEGVRATLDWIQDNGDDPRE